MAAYVVMSMLAAAMISAFMMLALSVSGTGGSCMLLFALFAGFVDEKLSVLFFVVALCHIQFLWLLCSAKVDEKRCSSKFCDFL
jgi:hypothetical protein